MDVTRDIDNDTKCVLRPQLGYRVVEVPESRNKHTIYIHTYHMYMYMYIPRLHIHVHSQTTITRNN